MVFLCQFFLKNDSLMVINVSVIEFIVIIFMVYLKITQTHGTLKHLKGPNETKPNLGKVFSFASFIFFIFHSLFSILLYSHRYKVGRVSFH